MSDFKVQYQTDNTAHVQRDKRVLLNRSLNQVPSTVSKGALKRYFNKADKKEAKANASKDKGYELVNQGESEEGYIEEQMWDDQEDN